MFGAFCKLFSCSTPEENPKDKEAPYVNPVYSVAKKLLRQKIDALVTNDHLGLMQEYSHLQDVSVVDYSEAAASTLNVCKNRYANVLPFDFNRVRISGDDDYINASTIETEMGEKTERCYIAAQGPLITTVEDFWRMLYETNCSILVMLTRNVENYHSKCADYYRYRVGESVTYGPFEITTRAVERLGVDITRRTLELVVTETQEMRQIFHYHYHRWPDFGTPLTTEPLRRLVRLTRDVTGQVVIHCSAGIGRTGTLITIDVILRRLWELAAQKEPVTEAQLSAALDFFGLVKGLREQRRGMVQTADQYFFCHEAVLHELEEEELGQAPSPPSAEGTLPSSLEQVSNPDQREFTAPAPAST